MIRQKFTIIILTGGGVNASTIRKAILDWLHRFGYRDCKVVVSQEYDDD